MRIIGNNLTELNQKEKKIEQSLPTFELSQLVHIKNNEEPQHHLLIKAIQVPANKTIGKMGFS